MTAIIDAAPLVAMADRRDPLRNEVRRVLNAEEGVLVVPAPVSAEVDYLLAIRVGAPAQRAFYRDVAAGRFAVEFMRRSDYDTALDVDQRYSDLELGLADISIIVMAQRFTTTRVVTFDHRDFRAVRPLQGGSFTLLPADEGL